MKTNKEKKKDQFYRRNLIRGISLTILFVIIGLALILTITYKLKDELDFAKTAYTTKAEIVDVKYRDLIEEESKIKYQKINVDKAQYIVIKYNINNIEYTGISRDMNSSMYIGKNINIYYNEKSPEQFIIIDYSFYIPTIVISAILIVVGIIGIVIEFKKIKRYIETLNGIEIRAEIIRVIEISKPWWKEYKIECIGKDETGDTHTFYTRNFMENITNEIKRMKLNTLKVRYKKYEPNKYIVLTESLEKRLSR